MTLIKMALMTLVLCASGLVAADLQTYSSKEHSFSIQYPAKWEKRERANGTAVAVVSPKDEKGGFRANANVIEQGHSRGFGFAEIFGRVAVGDAEVAQGL